MSKAMIGLCLLLFPALVCAGTWQDDFSDGNFDGWLKTFAGEPAASVWHVEDGVLKARRTSGYGAQMTIGDMETWENYTLECDMRVTERIPTEWGTNYHYAGVVGRVHHVGQITLEVTGVVFNLKQASTVWEFANIQWPNPGVWLRNEQRPFQMDLGIWYQIAFSVDGSRFTLEVDGERVSSFDNAATETGRVGLVVGGCAAEFDNVVITGNDVPDAGPSGWPVEPEGRLVVVWGRLKGF